MNLQNQKGYSFIISWPIILQRLLCSFNPVGMQERTREIGNLKTILFAMYYSTQNNLCFYLLFKYANVFLPCFYCLKMLKNLSETHYCRIKKKKTLMDLWTDKEGIFLFLLLFVNVKNKDSKNPKSMSSLKKNLFFLCCKKK